MRVLFDSNVIIDAITERNNSNIGSIGVFLQATSKDIDGYMISKQISDIMYVLRKYLDQDKIKSFGGFLCRAFNIIPFTKEDILGSLQLSGNDWEDNMIIYAAEKNDIDLIVTNNVKDFHDSSIKTVKPDELIKLMFDGGV